ncbi:prepilin-type N-terminal cleavage/methylation domain-containing protein [Sulfurimonas sp. HSL3-7]|uniref:type II secretion system protein n=1 Tax=Sulfonitrofixus jiaomeiensis TaxID=3131938 RepID=UPI0031F9BA3F
MKKSAFTMIELVFVIVVLGILAAIAVPKLAVTRDDAMISKGRSDVAAIRTGIVSERQARLVKGEHSFIAPDKLSVNKLFDGVMMYGITAGTGDGHWSGGGTSYTYKIKGESNVFTYTQATGKFECTSGSYCSKLTD